jgi:hypothetical protein
VAGEGGLALMKHGMAMASTVTRSARYARGGRRRSRCYPHPAPPPPDTPRRPPEHRQCLALTDRFEVVIGDWNSRCVPVKRPSAPVRGVTAFGPSSSGGYPEWKVDRSTHGT